MNDYNILTKWKKKFKYNEIPYSDIANYFKDISLNHLLDCGYIEKTKYKDVDYIDSDGIKGFRTEPFYKLTSKADTFLSSRKTDVNYKKWGLIISIISILVSIILNLC